MNKWTFLIFTIGAIILGWLISFDSNPNSSPFGEEYPTQKKIIDVLGKKMAYIEVGKGDSEIVFLHGNPTSSYLWRNIIPFVQHKARCIAPDLIGMGDSEKIQPKAEESLDRRYSLEEHYKHLDEFLRKILVRPNVTLVLHDWGGALGLHWANLHRDQVNGVMFMEAVMNPNISYSNIGFPMNFIFRAFRSSNIGEFLILSRNVFVEHILPGGILRRLSKKEMEEYRRPYLKAGEDRRPTLTWPREICFNGEKPANRKIIEQFMRWFEKSDIPKLWVNVQPGAIIDDSFRNYLRTFPNITEITVNSVHYVQEDAPTELGEALSGFIDKISKNQTH